MPDLVALQMSRTRVPQNSAATVTAHFRSQSDASAAAPAAAEYRVDDVGSGQEIRGWTALLEPAASMSIPIAPSDNAILCSEHVTERRRLTVVADRNTDDQVMNAIVWTVDNLLGAHP